MVVTIVVLIILATISINAVFGENGIIKRAEAAKRLHEQGVTDEQEGLNQLDRYLGDKINGVQNGDSLPDVPVETDTRPLVNKDTVNTTEHDKIVGKDKLGNTVVVPNGFKIAEDSGVDVEEGIVIEDSIGNQFVWIPVSNIDGDGVVNNQNASGLITKKDGSKVQITLGRYSFDSQYNGKIEGTGASTIVQKGLEYDAITNEGNINEKYVIKGFVDYNNYHYEFSAFRESNYKKDLTGQNATALNLQKFVQSVSENKGYYLGRYEASYGSGSSVSNYKPLSQKSNSYFTDSMRTREKTLWNFINQGDASKVSRNMYAGNSYVESDLINSYMWDTAIVYIQTMLDINYATAHRTNKTTLNNTGSTGDKKCNIFDMSENLVEWTTEYSISVLGGTTQPCTDRGGDFNGTIYHTALRYGNPSTYSSDSVGFRVGLYII